MYELTITPHPHTYTSTHHTFPHLLSHRHFHHTHDLYVPHPVRKNLWRWVGRADDVIVLSNGGLVHPSAMERVMGGCPGVAGVVVVGKGRRGCGMLVEAWQGEGTAWEGTKSTLKGDGEGDGEGVSRNRNQGGVLYNEGHGQQEAPPSGFRQYLARANEVVPECGRVRPQSVVFVRGMVRTDKGTVKRGQTVERSAKEVEGILVRMEEGRMTL